MPDRPESSRNGTHLNTEEVMFSIMRDAPNSTQAQTYHDFLRAHGWSAEEIQARLGITSFNLTAPETPTLSAIKNPSTPQVSMDKLHQQIGPQGYKGKIPTSRKHLRK